MSSFADVEPNKGMYDRQLIYKNNAKKGSEELFTGDELTSKNYVRVVNGVKYKVIYYNAVIPLKHLEFFKNMPICKGCNFKLNFNVNQAYFEVTKAANGTLTFNKNSYVNRGGGKTNPLMIGATGMIQHTVNMEEFKNTVIIPAGAAVDTITSAKRFVNNSTSFVDSVVPCGSSGLPASTYKVSNSIVTNNWTSQTLTGNGITKHGLTSCRLYAETYVLHPTFSSIYLNIPTMKVPYKNVTTKNILNVEAGGVFDITINNGVRNPVRLIIVPILSASANGTGAYSPLISPFTTEPATCSPYSISEFNVNVAGKPIFSGKELKYTHEHFKYELGHTSTLSYDEWINNYGYIVVDLKRRIKDEYNVLTSVSIQGRNTGRKNIDLYCFLEYEADVVLQLHTGKVEVA